MNIFLTGGTGFIGKYLMAELAASSHTIYALVRSEGRLQSTLSQLRIEKTSRIVSVIGDLTQPQLGLQPDDYEQILKSDVIIHAGGPMNIELSHNEARQTILHPAQEMAKLAARIHMTKGLKHFIHLVGFMSPYNEQNAMMDLDSELHNVPPYEKMKFQADSYIRKALAPLNIPLSTVNPSAVIGHSRSGVTEQIGGLSILVDAVRRNLMPLVPGGKGYWLPMVHVDHVASFVATLAGAQNMASNTYYLLDPKQDSPSIQALIHQIAAEMQAAPPIGSVPLPILKSVLGLGAGKRLGIPKESMNFLVKSEFPVESKTKLAQQNGLRSSFVPSTLPYVITDLDYRLSHSGSMYADTFVQRRRSKVVTLERDAPGTPVLFLHGTFSGADSFVPVAELLDGVPTWLIDLPGFGRTPFHRSSSVIGGYTEAIKEMIVELKRPVILVGHSFGGLIAAKVMEEIDEHIRQLLLLQPVLHRAQSALSSKSAGLTKTMLKHVRVPALKKQLLKSNHFAQSGERLDRYADYVIRDLKSPRVRTANAKVLASLAQSEPVQLRPEAWDTAKVNILWGEKDGGHHIPEPFSHISATYIPYGHQFPIENPAMTAEWIRQSLRD